MPNVRYAVVLVANAAALAKAGDPVAEVLDQHTAATGDSTCAVETRRVLADAPIGAVEHLVRWTADPAQLRRRLAARLAGAPVDGCVARGENRRKKLLVSDMDSTIIGCECIDELAAAAGVKPLVAAITARAMAGELAFEDSLRERVALLAGLPHTALKLVYDERVRLNRGARALVRTMRDHGAETLLVSGGFTFFADRVAEDAGFSATKANVLNFSGGRLTGTVQEPILGRDAKRLWLEREAARLEIFTDDVIAVGDGANDLGMMQVAGLSVAYRATPVVADAADGRIVTGDLRSALFFQGYTPDEMWRPEAPED